MDYSLIQKKKCSACKMNYGSDDRQGMCSVCYKDFKAKEGLNKEDVINARDNSNSSAMITDSVTKEPEITKPVQTNIYACWKCEKKVGYTGFKCRCEYIFCGTHKHFSQHDCDYDYRSKHTKLPENKPTGMIK